MNLKNLIDKQVFKTNQTKNLTINGITETYTVYRIPLNLLYFNDKNDRIATYIGKYEDDHKNPLNKDIMGEEYNDIIHDFIKKSKEDSFKKTKKNIKDFDQREAGIVLSDGRIIDGNRRYCCLRELNKENISKFGFFNSVILDKDLENLEKQIKILELMIQQGEDKKVDYPPIEKLVGIYKDIVKNKLLTEYEYAQSIGEDEKKVKEEVEIAKLIVEFLDFFNASEKFYIARELSLDGPIRELRNILKNKDDKESNEIKVTVFTFLGYRMHFDSNDRTRNVRNIIGKIVKNSKYKNSFLDDSVSLVKEGIKDLPKNTSLEFFDKLESNTDFKNKFKSHILSYKNKAESSEIKDRPIELLNKSLSALKEIDVNVVFAKFSESQKNQFNKLSLEIKEAILEIIGKTNV